MLHLFENRGLQGIALYVWHNVGANLALLAVEDTEHWSLVHIAGRNSGLPCWYFAACLINAKLSALVHVLHFAADVGLVEFDFGIRSAHFGKRAGLHSEPNAMQHEPSGFLS